MVNGYPTRNDNTFNLAYVGKGTGSTPPEQYMAYHGSSTPSSSAFVLPGQTAFFQNLQTGLFCRLIPVPSTYPLVMPSRAAWNRTAPRPPIRAAVAASAVRTAEVPSGCATSGIVCDQATAATATELTYTGYGLSHQGTPLVQTPGTSTLVLSSDRACTVPGGGLMSFPPAAGPLSPPPLAVTGVWQCCSRPRTRRLVCSVRGPLCRCPAVLLCLQPPLSSALPGDINWHIPGMQHW